MLNKTPLFHQSLGACVCLSFFLSLSPANYLERRNPSCLLPARASKTLSRRCTVPSPPQKGAQCLRELRKPCVKGIIGFLHKPRNISLFLSLFYFLIIDSRLQGSGPLKDLNTTPELIKTFLRKIFLSYQFST